MRSINCRALSITVTFIASIAIISVAYLSPMHDWDEVRIAERLRLLDNTVTALERAIDHLFLVGDNINVDGVFGVRILSDQLLTFLNKVELRSNSIVQEQPLNDILTRLYKLQKKAKKFQMQFTITAERNDPAYFKQSGYLMSVGTWDMWYKSRDIDRELLPSYEFKTIVKEKLSEKLSDACLREPVEKHCQFSENCWKLMSAPSYHGYSLTHEILFLLNAIAIGCERELEIDVQKHKSMSTDQLLAQESAAVLHEAELIAERDYPFYRQDLFMEQVAFGGILGYRDFFRDEWLMKILSWQTERGCYTSNITASLAQFNRDFPPKLHRKKREERPLADGCMSHVTAVAVAALGQYVRYLLEPLLEGGNFM